MQVFQVVPPVVREVGNGYEMDLNFYESLKIYLKHFESFAVACPVYSAELQGSGLERCISFDDLPWGSDRFKFIPLPVAYRPLEFMRALPRVRRQLRAEVEAAEHLIFTPYTLIGDWPAVAIREARKLNRPFTIEADGVHSDIMRKRHVSDVAWKRWVKNRLIFPAFESSHRHCLEHSSLAVFQGQDVYNAYARHCPNPVKSNHHIPVYFGDHITDAQLAAKLCGIRRGDPIKICYAGRAVDMKGPLDWVDTLHELMRMDVNFQAIWVGDGPMLEEMRAATSGMTNVSFTGFASDRQIVLDALKASDILLFCHNTLESARVLGEALACGAPLVGFETAYPVDLVAEHGGGLFSEMGNIEDLAHKVRSLDENREQLASLVTNAARSGRHLDREAALNKRAELIKHHRFSGEFARHIRRGKESRDRAQQRLANV